MTSLSATAPDEEWLEIPDWPDYEASSLGRIRSYKMNRPRILTGSISGSGYLRVKISRDCRKMEVTIHKLIATTFCGPKPAPNYEVRHLDGNRLNNRADNLAWGTPSDNRLDAVRHGTNAIVQYNARRAAHVICS